MSSVHRLAVVLVAVPFLALADDPRQVMAPVGDPLPALTAAERAMFEDGLDLYQHDFTAAEGLGPLFNERACSTCHGAPRVGGFDPDGTTNNVTHFTITGEDGQIFQAFEFGGGVFQKRSFASEGDPEGSQCALPPDSLPSVHGLGTSSRHTPAVFGFGLLDAIPDAQILEYQGRKPWKKPGVVGAANWGVELEGLSRLLAFHLDGTRTQPTGAPRVGRFGWKSQTATLFQFTTEPFNVELGVSTPFFGRENHPYGDNLPPECVVADDQPNDKDSQNSLRLFYFQAFLAAPDRGPITADVQAGEAVFDKLGCADCHRKSFRTGDYYIPLPDGTPHKVEAISNQLIYPYSDLLVHDMGEALADPRPMGRAGGRFWRTTPLWGLRHKSRFLHDGSATTISQSIRAHGGEGTWSKNAYESASEEERRLLHAFLNSL